MVKWTSDAQLKLLRTAIACDPGFKFDAKAVVAAWPVDDNEEVPTERAVGDQFKKIKQHGRDLAILSSIHKGGKETNSVKKEAVKDRADTMVTPKSTSATRCRSRKAQSHGSVSKNSTGGSKRKRRSRVEVSESEMEMTSGNETESGCEMELNTPSKKPHLRVRKSVAAPVAPADSDIEVDAGAKDYGSGSSDEDFDIAKERRM